MYYTTLSGPLQQCVKSLTGFFKNYFSFDFFPEKDKSSAKVQKYFLCSVKLNTKIEFSIKIKQTKNTLNV